MPSLTYDALGHMTFHARIPAAAVAYPQFYHSTDGLRLKAVLGWQVSSKATATMCWVQGTI